MANKRSHLVFTRSVGETIVIGKGDDAVIVKLEEIRSKNDVRIGVHAKRNVEVNRLEVFKQKYPTSVS